MTNKEIQIRSKLMALLAEYHVRLEEYNDKNLPEMGFISNYRSLRIVGAGVDIDLFNLAKKINT